MIQDELKILDVVQYIDEENRLRHWLCVLLEYNKNGYEHIGYSSDIHDKGIQLIMEDGTSVNITHNQKYKMSANDLPDNAKIIGKIDTYEYGRLYGTRR